MVQKAEDYPDSSAADYFFGNPHYPLLQILPCFIFFSIAQILAGDFSLAISGSVFSSDLRLWAALYLSSFVITIRSTKTRSSKVLLLLGFLLLEAIYSSVQEGYPASLAGLAAAMIPVAVPPGS